MQLGDSRVHVNGKACGKVSDHRKINGIKRAGMARSKA